MTTSPRNSGPPFRPLILCADDFGLSPGVSTAIAELAEVGAISAISCMTCSPSWLEAARLLSPTILDSVDVGLHLSLTSLPPISPEAKQAFGERIPSPSQLFKLALMRKLNPRVVAAELNAQLEAFQDATGRTPIFIDGHHHVHAYPVIRDVVVHAACKLQADGSRVYVRNLCDKPCNIIARGGAILKAQFLAGLSIGLHRTLLRREIPTNPTFSGVRDYSDEASFAQTFPQLLSHHKPNGIVMVHPGHPDGELSVWDNYIDGRSEEFNYLFSTDHKQMVLDGGAELSRFVF